MKTLVVHAHPRTDSFGAQLFHDVVEALRVRGADVRVHNLYADNFNPVLSEWERSQHLEAPLARTSKDPLLRRYTDDVTWCDSIVFVYPTWWSGQPTMVKGWFDRVLINGVAWTFPSGASRIHGNLSNVRSLTAVTTHGSTKFLNMLQGESGKRVLFRSVRAMCHWRCRTRWIAMYNVDRAQPREFQAFRERVKRRIAALA